MIPQSFPGSVMLFNADRVRMGAELFHHGPSDEKSTGGLLDAAIQGLRGESGPSVCSVSAQLEEFHSEVFHLIINCKIKALKLREIL